MTNLLEFRGLFPIAQEFAYFNHAAISPLNNRVAGAVQHYLEVTQRVPFERWPAELSGVMARMKERVAQLIGAAAPSEIIPMANTAAGINTAAQSLPLRAGDNVLVLDGDYPAVIYPWLNLAPRGVLVKWVPQTRGGLDLEILRARIDARTRVIAISTAMFATGFRNDIAAVGDLCRERGIFLVVDAIQTLGAFPIDVQACHIDFLSCGAQKWLLSTPGSGFLYCRQDLIASLQLGAYVGTGSTVDAANYLDYNFTLLPTAERFNLGTPNLPGIVALDAALGLILEAGPARIGDRVLALTDLFIADMQDRGYRVRSNLDPAHRSGIVIVEVPAPEAARLKLLDAGIITSVRGGSLRISPHFYNREDELRRVGAVLD
ncbi:MAG TPA: aminotransferase class V-fold PLP-dependent enzyme, partial [Chloroflexota bacterium]